MLYYMVRMFPVKIRADYSSAHRASSVPHMHCEIEIITDDTKSQDSYRFHVFLHRAGGKILLTSWITVKWEWE